MVLVLATLKILAKMRIIHFFIEGKIVPSSKYQILKVDNSLPPCLRILRTVLPIFSLILFVPGCESKVKVSSELRELRERYRQVQDDMKEAEVIEIFEGYESSVGDFVREVDPNSKPLKRPSKYVRMFCEKKSAVEGDHFVWVYLDEAGYVVGKHLGELCR